MTYFLRGVNGAARKISFDLTTAPRVGKPGGAGTIYLDPSNPANVFKIYHSVSDIASRHRDKVFAMLGNPPNDQTAVVQGKSYVQLAWPLAVIEEDDIFRGFSMPLINTTATVSGTVVSQRRTRNQEGIREDYAFRLTVARNLASVIDELHRCGHYVIDLHGGNLKVYRNEGLICLLDADGFSIVAGSGERFPAERTVLQIRSPEGQSADVTTLGKEQDLFALAVLIFELLNEGLHPYSGVPRSGCLVPNVLEGRIAQRLYAYGQVACGSQTPSPHSIHEWFEDDSRALFDRAFSVGPPRPAAQEWRDHLDDLVGRLVQCRTDPSHFHFSKGCPWCAKAGRPLTTRKPTTQVIAPAVNMPRLRSPRRPPRRRTSRPIGLIAVAIFVTFLAYQFFQEDKVPVKVLDAPGRAPVQEYAGTPSLSGRADDGPGNVSLAAPSSQKNNNDGKPDKPQTVPTKQRVSAKNSVCYKGAQVAAKHSTRLEPISANEQSATCGASFVDIGMEFEVEAENPVLGDRCSVVYHGPWGCERGTIGLKDIGPLQVVRNQIANRALNRPEETTLADFPEKLRQALSRRAQELKIDPQNYEVQIDDIVKFVHLCSEITKEQYDEATMERASAGQTNVIYERYSQCEAPVYNGHPFRNPTRSLLVGIHLKGEKTGRPYQVIIQTEYKREMDGKIVGDSLLAESTEELILDYYDHFGIANFAFSEPQGSAGQNGALSPVLQSLNKLSASDVVALALQLARCWNAPALAKGAQYPVVDLDVKVNPDRTVSTAEAVDQRRMASDPNYAAVVRSAIRAVRAPECTPLQLPPDKYQEWQSLLIHFDPKEVFVQ